MDPFKGEDEESHCSFNPFFSAFYKPLELTWEDTELEESRSECYENNFSDLMGDNEEFDMPMQPAYFVEESPTPFYDNSKEIETMNRLNDEGFFDKNEIDDIEVCRIRHDKHHPKTLSRRIICRIGSETENISTISLMLIDLFVQKANETVIEGFCFKFLAEKVFKNYDFEIIKKSVMDKSPTEAIKVLLQRNDYGFDDETMDLYRIESVKLVHDSLHLISYNQIECIQDFEVLQNKTYKQFEGKLDRSPRISDRRTRGSDIVKYTMHDSETQSTSNEVGIPLDFDDSDEEDDQFVYDQEIYQNDPLTHRISVADSYMDRTFDNEFTKLNDTSDSPLETGMLFTILFKKFSKMLSNSMTENLLVTNIFTKLAAISLSDDNPGTFYLHVFVYIELKNKRMGMLNTLNMISETINSKSQFHEFSSLKEVLKQHLGSSEAANKIDVSTLRRSGLEEAYNEHSPMVYGSIIFEEFLKEYISIFETKKYIIDMMREFECVKTNDISLDQAISKLRKPFAVTN